MPAGTPTTSLRNLGPTTAAMLEAVGIDSAEALREAGALLAYKILRHRYPTAVGLLTLYALEGALTDRHWNSFTPEERARMKADADGDLEIGTA